MEILYDNGLPLKIIGYAESSLTSEFMDNRFSHFNARTVLTPEQFLALQDKEYYQYAVGFNKDVELRKRVLSVIEEENLNCPSIVYDHSVQWTPHLATIIGKGTLVGQLTNLCHESRIGNYCIIEDYSMLSHYTTVGDNVHLHAGTMIGGKAVIGNHVTTNLRATVLNKVQICDDVLVGAVSTVTKCITKPGVYMGSIARRVGDMPDMLK